jgi:predicted small secreted protein
MKHLLSLVILTLVAVSLTSCNTISGAGQDVSNAGQDVSKAANKVKNAL